MKWLTNTKANRALIPERGSKKAPNKISGYNILLLHWKFTNSENDWGIRMGYYNPGRNWFYVQGVTGTIEVSHFMIIKKPKK